MDASCIEYLNLDYQFCLDLENVSWPNFFCGNLRNILTEFEKKFENVETMSTW